VLELASTKPSPGNHVDPGLNGMADQIHAIMAKYNYTTGKLEPLR
jgi:hypothetical protein